VVNSRIWGYERAYARSYPQIRELTTEILNETSFWKDLIVVLENA
jgi:hypothetical protein